MDFSSKNQIQFVLDQMTHTLEFKTSLKPNFKEAETFATQKMGSTLNLD